MSAREELVATGGTLRRDELLRVEKLPSEPAFSARRKSVAMPQTLRCCRLSGTGAGRARVMVTNQAADQDNCRDRRVPS